MDNTISHCELLSQGTWQICLKELIQVISITRMKLKKEKNPLLFQPQPRLHHKFK